MSEKLILQDDDESKQRYPHRDVGPRCDADYAWDYPTAPSKRLQFSCDGVPLPRNIDIMAIGIQPPMKVSVSLAIRHVSFQADFIGWTANEQ
jgi:hypothetical protein